MSVTKLGPGSATAEADAGADDAMNGRNLPAHRPPNALGDTLGDTKLDVKPSFLDIAYGVSKWNEGRFTDGAFVLDRDDQIAMLGDPLTVILLRKREYWMTYPEPNIPRSDYEFWGSEQEAIDAGRRTQFPEDWAYGDPKPNAIEAADLQLLVQMPAKCASTRFVFKLGDSFYAFARFHVNKLWKGIKDPVLRMALYEARKRGVPESEGRFDRYFLRLTTAKVQTRFGQKMVKLSASLVPGENGPTPVPAEVWEDLDRFAQAAAAAPASDSEFDA